MMKFLNSLFLILYFIMGCTHKCPEFNEDLLNWTPYEINDQIVLQSQLDSTLIFMVKTLQIDHTISYPSMALCTCMDVVHVSIAAGDIRIPVDIMGYENNESFDLNVFEITWEGIQYTSCESKLINFSMNNKVYKNSWLIEFCSLEGQIPIGSIVFAESIGLIYIEINEETYQMKSPENKLPDLSAFRYSEEKC